MQAFEGTIIVVSHDREFLQGLTNKVFEFVPGDIKEHLGDIFEFLDKKQMENFRALELEKEASQKNNVKKNPAANAEFDKKKEDDKEQRRLKNALDKAEAEVARLDKEIAEIDLKLKDPEQYKVLTQQPDFFAKYEALKKQQAEAVEKWETAAMEFEG
jgi:ATP-binding cassette subfamily F protein 3